MQSEIYEGFVTVSASPEVAAGGFAKTPLGMDGKPNMNQAVPYDAADLAEAVGFNLRFAQRHLRTDKDPSGKRKPRSTTTEPQVAMLLVQPILNIIGYGGRTDPDGLQREHVILRGMRVDFACMLEREIVWTVEVKNLGLNIRDDVAVHQACNYASAAGTRYALLTDGITWAVYDLRITKARGQRFRPRDRLVEMIDLRKSSSASIAGFFRALSRSNAEAGDIWLKPPNDDGRSPGKAAANKKGRRRHRRISLRSPKVRRHFEMVSSHLDCPLLPMESGRNVFITPTRETVRFYVSAGGRGQSIFSIREGHLVAGHIALVSVADATVWVIPANDIRSYFVSGDEGQVTSITPRLSRSEGRDVLVTNASTREPFDISRYRVAA